MKILHVCCAIIKHEDKILAVKRSGKMRHPMKWEFPGGKVEPFESDKECIIREIKEELNIVIAPTNQLNAIMHTYPDFKIKLIPFVCEMISGDIRLSEHIQFDWFEKSELFNLSWTQADEELLRSDDFKIL